MELKQHPALSYGKHIDDDNLVVIKVDEGDYEGTVFSFRDVAVQDDDTLGYGIDFHSFFYKGEPSETEPSIRVMTEFYETISTPFMTNVLIQSANGDAA